MPQWVNRSAALLLTTLCANAMSWTCEVDTQEEGYWSTAKKVA